MFHVTEDDKQIVRLKHFVDSVVTVSLIKKIKEHVAQQGAQN